MPNSETKIKETRKRRKKRKRKPIEVWLLSFVFIVMLTSIFFAFMTHDVPLNTLEEDTVSTGEMTDPVQNGDSGNAPKVNFQDLESAPVESDSTGKSTGLETDNMFFPVCIVLNGDVSGESEEREAIQTEVESLLGSAGIKFQISGQAGLDQSIEIRVDVFDNSFFASIRFIRWIDYHAAGNYHTLPVPVYSIGSLGTKGTGTHDLADSVGGNMTKFLNEFLRVNN